jgi:7-carboxy-7-deazaguanine synthase
MTTRGYTVNEIFCSVQGEGVRAGTLNHFVRFSGCNLQCKTETHGFDCDTEFVSGRKMTADDIMQELVVLNPACWNVIFTGGEPLLQLDAALTTVLHNNGYHLSVETNGSLPVPEGVTLDWITCSPKVAEHAVRLVAASEVKYVRGYGQGIPRPAVKAEHKLISPAFAGMELDRRALAWCIDLINQNPEWRLSLQTHKFIHVR